MIVVASLSLLAFLAGLALLVVAVVARMQEDRYQPVADRHHLGVLRPMPYDWQREAS